MLEEEKEAVDEGGSRKTGGYNNRWWWGLPAEELDRVEEEAYRRIPVQPDEFYIHPDKRARPDDWDNDAFWERFYQEWLKEQEGNSAEPSAQQG